VERQRTKAPMITARISAKKKALTINIIILMGSAAMVNINMASGGPKARQAQPKKSITVIFFSNGRDVESRFPFLFSSFPYRFVSAGASKR